MAGDKILVFGATGPAGIVLPRELLHRKLPALAYCRSPSKIPNNLASHPLLEGICPNAKPAKSRGITSLLGPSSTRQPKNTEFADYYRTIVSLMKEHQVHRLLALGTTAIYQPDDHSSISRALMCNLIKVVASGAYHNFIGIQD
ncbi:hypothetical protein FOQG_13688 [Fusarium oxysporum f. sp. raphani 54005]|uniref:NAD(P)-binding domain-containing protein n=3 Tax=Fusarium oxysporum TaxID=5507 RepID=X0BTV6_FUSOX|nr:hypothetical protein FOQG_13688 [Fusarium oxysporum f. sp. raphani 54005]EXL65515.1 hypothetical protein FOPG_18260 [Fusarium oxysporum f. sp. conglutinans race 2 54008]KAF6513938.1 hypothetical protein HZS61_006194 [Fusarium oxysporum f. sp. conglutinans]KAI8395015.1 hypothetical protein FOFC_21645 [Fusarium oxysporum]KAG6988628.1 hypothetical protein FocnCong_v001928 [Fusarium oxysporum f. sp. conglutinans]